MTGTNYLSRFLKQFDPHRRRRAPTGEFWIVLLIGMGACVSIASLNALALIGGIIVLAGLAIGFALREEVDSDPYRYFDRELVENFGAIKSDEVRGDLGIGWDDEAVRSLERCAQAWVMVSRALARRYWTYRTLTKSWRNLWIDVHWAADSSMLEALWSAQRSAAFFGLGRTRDDAVLHLRQVTDELVELAFQVSQDAFPGPMERSAVQEVIEVMELTRRAREELDRDVPGILVP